jgi:ACR3 family arsenite efflux pump ArsB
MFAIAWFFLVVVFEPFIEPQLASEYLAGAILLLGISRIQVPWDTVILSVVIRRRGERW